MLTLNIEQGTEEWFDARRGIPTASNFDKIVTTKGELSKQADKYMNQLAGESVSGYRDDSYKSDAMERGTIMETEARIAYEIIMGVKVEQVGLFLNDDKTYACSPDGLVGDDGLLEIKCPLIHTHVEYLLDGEFPSTYFQQVQGQLFVTGRSWCDFMSYYPGIKPFIIRIKRDEKFSKALGEALESFNKQLQDKIRRIK